jgi:hypothetical protein
MKMTKSEWTGAILSLLIGLFFAFNVLVKLFPQVFYPQMVEQMKGIGLPETIVPLLASLEGLCTLLYLIPITSVLGAVLFTGYLGGAMLAHLRVGENVLIHLILGGLIWLGIYLREPRLRSLLPLRGK